MLLLNESLLLECLLLLLFVSLSTQSGNFWIHPCTFKISDTLVISNYTLMVSSKVKKKK
jgi:hypothetical protein